MNKRYQSQKLAAAVEVFRTDPAVIDVCQYIQG
jgi:hypothetical protein